MKSIVRGILSLLLLMSLVVASITVQAGGIPVGGNVQITDAGLGEFGDADEPDIVAMGDNVYAVWKDDRDGNNASIFFARSIDGGATWSANKRVSTLPYDDWTDNPSIAVQPDGTIWIIWYLFYRDESQEVNDIRAAFSRDGGETFERRTLVDGFDEGQDFWQPQIAVDQSDGRIYILYRDFLVQGSQEGYKITLRAYNAQGENGIETVVNDQLLTGRITDGLLDSGPRMSLMARAGTVCAAWEDQRSRFAIYGACSTDDGQTFGANVAISGPDAVFPRIALAPDGTLYGTYTGEDDARRNIILRRSADKGATWSEPIQITNVATAFEVADWDLAVDANGQLLLSWINEGISSSDLYLATSLDQGQNFANIQIEDAQGRFPTVSDQRRVTLDTSGSGTNTRVFLAWQDDRNVQDEIWSARLSLDGVAPTAPENLQAIPADSSIVLRWDSSTDATGIQGYRVYRAPAGDGPYTELSPFLVTGTSYRDVGLDNTTYYYQVAAVDGTGNTSPRSNQASAAAQIGTDLPLYGTIAYEAGDDIRLRDLPDLGQERTIAQGRQPRFAPDGQRLYTLANETISSQNVGGGDVQSFFQTDGLAEYDIAADETHFASLILRQFGAPGAPGGICTVLEPHVGLQGQDLYTSQYEFASGVALSADHRWMVYNTQGFCNTAASGVYSPGNFCIVDVASNEENCLEGADHNDADFAASGNTLVFVADLTGQNEVWKASIQSDGTLSSYTQLTRSPVDQPASDPSWSSDGNWIIFQRDIDPGEGEDARLYAVRSDGAALRSLDIAGENPTWFGGGSAPDGIDLPNRIYLPAIVR